jgi:hypothetical protein
VTTFLLGDKRETNGTGYFFLPSPLKFPQNDRKFVLRPRDRNLEKPLRAEPNPAYQRRASSRHEARASLYGSFSGGSSVRIERPGKIFKRLCEPLRHTINLEEAIGWSRPQG